MTKIIRNLSMESRLLQNKSIKIVVEHEEITRSGIMLHVYVACNILNVVFLKRFSKVKPLI
jgi:hypothetical protein